MTVRVSDGELRVMDSGPGIDPVDLPYVFNRFYRADSARGMPGSGLGLAIVKQIADSHGGTARARNARGGGAMLTITFEAFNSFFFFFLASALRSAQPRRSYSAYSSRQLGRSPLSSPSALPRPAGYLLLELVQAEHARARRIARALVGSGQRGNE